MTACSCSCPAGVEGATAVGPRASTRAGASRAAVGRAAQRRRAPSVPARPARDGPFARQTLLRIHERSGGNPFFALELARLSTRTPIRSSRSLFPRRSRSSCAARIAGFPAATREALALASALGAPSTSLLERAGVAADALDPAVAAQRDRARERDRFASRTRCLRRFSIRTSATSDATLHGPCAAIVEDPLLRARHLALSTDAPDADCRRRARRRRQSWRPIAAHRLSRPSSPSTHCG